LPRKQQSGLLRGLKILKNIDGIAMLELTSADVVRHRLVKLIIDAYDRSNTIQNQIDPEKVKTSNSTDEHADQE
jgi:phosphate starvation-inducible PhoH-like protein